MLQESLAAALCRLGLCLGLTKLWSQLTLIAGEIR